MFDSLKKKLKEGVARLSRNAGKPEKPLEEKPKDRPPEVKPRVKPPKRERPEPGKPRPTTVAKERPEPTIEKPVVEEPLEEKPVVEEIPEKSGRLARLRGIRERVSTREISEKDIDDFFKDSEVDLLQSNVALSVIEKMKSDLKTELARKPVSRTKVGEFITEGFEKSLLNILDQGEIDLEKTIKKARAEGRPSVFVFLGYNGVGKTSAIAKLAHKLKQKGYSIVFAASDTFRSAAQEQLEVHGNKLGIKVIKHGYGADPAAVLFDAIKYAKAKSCDIVMADTAGRMHTNVNLADELKKICRVNKPDLKILVLDSLTGNDIVPQGEMFNEMVGVDAVIITKVDVDTKGGAIISAAFVLKKPIIYITTGQGYNDIEDYKPKKIVDILLG